MRKTVRAQVIYMVLGQIPPGQIPPDNNPPMPNTPGHIPTIQKYIINNTYYVICL